jgi:hypothetical protein
MGTAAEGTNIISEVPNSRIVDALRFAILVAAFYFCWPSSSDTQTLWLQVAGALIAYLACRRLGRRTVRG